MNAVRTSTLCLLVWLAAPLSAACSITPAAPSTAGRVGDAGGGTTASTDSGGGETSDDGKNALLAGRLAQLGAPLVDTSGVSGKAVGLVIGVSSPKGRVVVGLGATSRGGATKPGATTIFELGSVTKTYTGVLFGIALNMAKVGLEAPIDPLFPAGTPHYGDKSITLLDLATHTSGLPNMPTNLHSSDPSNPGAGYTEEDLASFLASYTLTVEPGTTYEYSNVGAGLLGQILVKRAGAPKYEALVKQALAQPLGLQDTTVAMTSEQQARATEGHRNGKPVPANVIGEPIAGGGALRSTGEDVLKFVEAALGTGPADVTAGWKEALQSRRPSDYGSVGFLVNVATVRGVTTYSKGGQTAGFSSNITFTTSPLAAVVLLSNSADTDGAPLRDLAQAILEEIR